MPMSREEDNALSLYDFNDPNILWKPLPSSVMKFSNFGEPFFSNHNYAFSGHILEWGLLPWRWRNLQFDPSLVIITKYSPTQFDLSLIENALAQGVIKFAILVDPSSVIIPIPSVCLICSRD